MSSAYAAVLLGMAVSASADTWVTHPAPGPGGPPHSALTRVSCVSSDFCMTVGASDYGLGRLGLPRRPIATFADRWDGSTWRLLPMPAVSGSPGLMSLSCVSSTFCVAVGSTQTTGRGSAAGFGGRAKPRALVETWDGAAWTVRPTPLASSPNSALSGVSCASSSFCLAVGTSGLAWDGTSWTRLRLPSVRYGSSLSAIACVAAEDCWAVGSYNAYKAGPDGTRPLAAHWSGGRWTVARPPAESDRYRGKAYANPTWLTAISCPTPSWCLATGLTLRNQNIFPQGGFADLLTGGHWTRAAAGIARNSPLYDLACVAQDDCYAAGQYDPKTQTPQSTQKPLIEHWAAGRWARVPIPRVATLPDREWTTDNLLDPNLFGITCLPQIGCTAVGAQPHGSASAPLVLSDVPAAGPSG